METCCICGKREAKEGCQYCQSCEDRYLAHGAQDPRD
jgi:hypothetical protein